MASDPQTREPLWHLRVKGTAALLTLVAFALRVHGLDFQSLWRDEVDSLHFATRDLPSLVEAFFRAGENGPLYFALLRPWVSLVGTSEFALRYSSLWAGVLLAPLLFLLGRRLRDRRVGLLAALLAAISPYLIWYSQELKMYSLVATLSALSAYFLLSSLLRNRWLHWMGFVATVVVNLWLHLLAALIIPFGLSAFVVWPRKSRSLVLRGSAAFGFLFSLYLPFAIWEVPLWLSPFRTGHPEVPLGSMLASILFAFSMNAAPSREILPISLFIFLLLAGLTLYRSGLPGGQKLCSRAGWLQARWGAAFAGLYLAVPISGVYVISLGMPIFTDRYLMVAIPAFFLLLAMGLVAVGERMRISLPLCLLLLALVDFRSLAFQSQTLIKADFRSAAAYVVERASPGEPLLFLIPYVERNFRHYYKGDLVGLEAPYTNGGMTEDELATRMEAMVRGHRSLWLISSEPELWDQRGLVSEWLQEHGILVEERDFARVRVCHYLLP